MHVIISLTTGKTPLCDGVEYIYLNSPPSVLHQKAEQQHETHRESGEIVTL